MSVKQKYYNTKAINKLDWDYAIVLGGRSTGKSYAIKKERIINSINNPETGRFILLRRYELDIKTDLIERYFSDMDVSLLTNKEYDCISVYQKKIYLSNTLENGKIERGRVIGYVRALSQDEHYKSGIYTDCSDVIYEEFVSNNYYLPKEPYRLLQFISTVARRNKIKVWMIGNTISRVCPYFSEWQLRNIPRQKAGTIEIYTHKSRNEEDGKQLDIKIAVEYTENGGKIGGMFFGSAGEHIDGGAWVSEDKPHLPKKRDCYTKMHNMIVEYSNFRFYCEFLIDNRNGACVWYIVPKTTEVQSNTRIISDKLTVNPLYTIGFIPLSKQEDIAFSYLKSGNICYSDNLTGTDFENCYKMLLT